MDDIQCVGSANETIDGVIAAIADAQFGVFSRRQALTAGITPRQIQLRVSGKRWETCHGGVYRIVGAPGSLHQSAMAAALYAGEGALVSHGTAGLLWEIEGVRSTGIELWVPSAKKSDGKGLTIHRGTRLDRADGTTFGPIPITTVARTVIDLSARMEDARLLSAMEHAFRRGPMTPERLSARVEALRKSGRPGAGRLADLVAGRADAPALESALEAKVWLLLRRSGLQLPQRQFWVSLPGGRYRLDFTWPDQRVGLECDGWEHHGRRSAFAPDRARLAEFAAAHWRILPVTWTACTQTPKRVECWLRHALAA